jgi:hypothetical protein
VCLLVLQEPGVDLGYVSAIAHDFFTPQPVKDAAVFVLRFITHNWSNAYAQKILRLLRDAAQPTTKLVLIEFMIPYAVREPKAFANISSAEQPSVPEPLIPNLVSGWIGTARGLQVSVKRLRSWFQAKIMVYTR